MTRNSILPLLLSAAGLALGCGPVDATTGGQSGRDGGGEDASPVEQCNPNWPEICDGIDNNCNGLIDEGFDKDGDGFTTCGVPADCDDDNPNIFPGATEILNGKDDDCDGKIDNKIPGHDYDKDGTPYPQDCNDEEPLVGPNAVEVGGDGVDNNCNGLIDEPANDCEAQVTGNTAGDYARAMGICNFLEASFVGGHSAARAIRTKFGTNFGPKAGNRMIQISTGRAVDNIDDPNYAPQSGTQHSFSSASHPLCAAPAVR
jgi:hypothetical protein